MINWFKSTRSAANGQCVEAAWMTSTKSGTNGNCVQVHTCAEADQIWVRDSKNPDGPVLKFTLAEWTAFTGGVKEGEFS